MNIQVKRLQDESLLTIHKLRWSLLSRRYYLFTAITFAVGLVFIITEYRQTSSGSAIGLALDLFAFMYLITWFGSYDKAVAKIKKAIAAGSETQSAITMQINDSKFNYESSEMKLEYSWRVFTGYKLYQDCIFLLAGDYINSFVIRKSDVTEAEFGELFLFVAGFLPEKKW